MHAIVNPSGRRPVLLYMSFEDFLSSGSMRRQALTEMCRPDDLVLDHLPGFDASDPEEIRQAFAEACERAVDGAVCAVRLDDRDLRFIRRRYLHPRFAPLHSGPLPAA